LSVCTADDLVEVLAGLVAVRGAPEHLGMDNGPELLAWALRDWCRLTGTRTAYIEPGAPWESPYVESFNGRVRDELLNIEEFTSLTVAQIVVEAWRIEYNTYRPHSALGGLTPPNTQPTGPAPTNPHSHSEWTTNRGPISGSRRPATSASAWPASWADDWPAMTVVVRYGPVVRGPDVASVWPSGHELGRRVPALVPTSCPANGASQARVRSTAVDREGPPVADATGTRRARPARTTWLWRSSDGYKLNRRVRPVHVEARDVAAWMQQKAAFILCG
jgi:putative transposase